jgi:hypothetical protein
MSTPPPPHTHTHTHTHTPALESQSWFAGCNASFLNLYMMNNSITMFGFNVSDTQHISNPAVLHNFQGESVFLFMQWNKVSTIQTRAFATSSPSNSQASTSGFFVYVQAHFLQQQQQKERKIIITCLNIDLGHELIFFELFWGFKKHPFSLSLMSVMMSHKYMTFLSLADEQIP